jgi:hypothetical protein
MPTPTYTLIDSVTLASSASSVTFSSIDQTYGDLVLVVDGKAEGKTGLYLQFNGDSGSNYTTVGMQGEASGASSYSQTLAFTNANLMAGAQGLNTVQLMAYSATDKHKTILARANFATEQVRAAAARWASTSAITQVRLFMDSGRNFQIGTTLNLYGITSEVV